MSIIDFSKIVKPEKLPFEAVYEQYYQEVLRYTQRKVGNRQDAEDLTADTFLYCYQNYESYDPDKSAVRTWIYLVVNSRIKNHYRDKKETVEFTALDNWLFTDEPDMERTVYLEELQGFVAKQLEELPERQQKVIIMRYFQNKDYSEIADELDTTPGNIRVILSRTLAKLQQELNMEQNDWVT